MQSYRPQLFTNTEQLHTKPTTQTDHLNGCASRPALKWCIVLKI